MSSLIIAGAAVWDGPPAADVLIENGRIVAIDNDVERVSDVEVLDARGATLLPGLWDHHIHLLALAASLESVPVGPAEVSDRGELTVAIQQAPRDRNGWVRATGYHESVAGVLDRQTLDRMVAVVPVRVQHRSGAMWMVNGAAAERLGLDEASHPGIERDETGRATGRFFGADSWLRDRLGWGEPPDLVPVSRLLRSYGVVGVTDLTPSEAPDSFGPIAAAVQRQDLRQHVIVTGGPSLTRAEAPRSVGLGPVKLLLADHRLPEYDEVTAWITAAHEAGRAVAVHTVTRASLALVLAAFDQVASIAGDRIEHGAVMPPELVRMTASLGLTVVTQPNFLYERGDQYLDEVEADDLPHLYPCARLREAGVGVAGGTDAPFGSPDPWLAIRTATDRHTRSGQQIGAYEEVDPRTALELFLGPPDAPAAASRRVAVGEPADLCLVDGEDLLAENVRATIIAGEVVHHRR